MPGLARAGIVPGAHGRQAVEPGLATRPSSHLRQVAEPTAGWYSSAGQGVQTLVVAAAEVPAGQATHFFWASRTMPAGQKHVAAATLDTAVAAAEHGWHAEAPASLNVLAVRGEHDAAPCMPKPGTLSCSA